MAAEWRNMNGDHKEPYDAAARTESIAADPNAHSWTQLTTPDSPAAPLHSRDLDVLQQRPSIFLNRAPSQSRPTHHHEGRV
jgi:hypothetical protein